MNNERIGNDKRTSEILLALAQSINNMYKNEDKKNIVKKIKKNPKNKIKSLEKLKIYTSEEKERLLFVNNNNTLNEGIKSIKSNHKKSVKFPLKESFYSLKNKEAKKKDSKAYYDIKEESNTEVEKEENPKFELKHKDERNSYIKEDLETKIHKNLALNEEILKKIENFETTQNYLLSSINSIFKDKDKENSNKKINYSEIKNLKISNNNNFKQTKKFNISTNINNTNQINEKTIVIY